MCEWVRSISARDTHALSIFVPDPVRRRSPSARTSQQPHLTSATTTTGSARSGRSNAEAGTRRVISAERLSLGASLFEDEVHILIIHVQPCFQPSSGGSGRAGVETQGPRALRAMIQTLWISHAHQFSLRLGANLAKPTSQLYSRFYTLHQYLALRVELHLFR